MRLRFLSALALTTVALPGLAWADTAVKWDGSTGNWSASSHWGLGSGYPNNLTVAPFTQYDVTIDGGTLAMDVNATVSSLANDLGNDPVMITLNGPGALTDTGFFLETNVTIGAGATLNITGSNSDDVQVFNILGTFNAPTSDFFVHAASTFSGQVLGGRIRVLAPVTVQGSPTVAKGLLDNYLTGTLAGTMTMVNATTLTLSDGGVLSNEATLTMGSGVIRGVLPQYGGAAASVIKNMSTGTLTISAGTGKLSMEDDSPGKTVLTLLNQGLVSVATGTLVLGAAMDATSNGTFNVASGARLEFAANYDFSKSSGPKLTGSGTVVVDAGSLLTLALDTAFTGTIEVDGALKLAPALNPLALEPGFSVVQGAAAPEPATLGLVALAAPLLFRRRRRTSTHTH